MNKKTLLFYCMFAPFILRAQQPVAIIPQPVSLQLKGGAFSIDNTTSLSFDSNTKDVKAAADFFAACIRHISGYTLPLNGKSNKVIVMKIETIPAIGAEGYQLSVAKNAITIKANTKSGIIYGIQSLLQTLPAIRTNAALQVPCMEITDYPRFKWRGMHLDVCRHFFSPDMVKEYIDLMAEYKMNVFHWHLTDDQGWRIEIKKYPKLTSAGAWRVERRGKTWGDKEPQKEGEAATYGGYYTQQQIKDIVAYAQERSITIVPEIEMPGHSAAAIAAYPQLSCTQQPQFVVAGGQYPKDVQSNYCAGNDSVFTFLQNVLLDVIQLFPGQYIHVGGDEVDKTSWKNCPKCQARIKAEGLKDENGLQSYFIRRMEKFIIAQHKKLIGWDEILEGGLAPEATVMSWRGESGGIQAAQMKHDVVMTPGSPCYFDQYQAGPEGEPLAIGGFNTLKKVYNYEPVPKELNSNEAGYVLGAQANVWTEYIPTVEHLEYMVLPRMAALAEVIWTARENKNWISFNQRLQIHFKAYEQKGLHYCPGNFTVAIQPSSQNGNLFATLSTEIPDGDIYYTTDKSDPATQSNKYTTPVKIDSSVTIKAVTVVDGKVMGVKPAEQSFALHKAIGRNVQYTYPASKYYPADGPNTLTDGVRGTTAVGKYWHGINGKDLIATIDLGSEQSIHKIAIGCLQNYRDWIFLPQSVTFAISADGKSFTELQTVNNTVSVNEKNPVIKDFTASFPTQQARYIRVAAKNLGVCPKGHSGEGQPAWVFADEIMVE